MTERLPLAGIRVLDFTRLLPGPYATLVLTDLGAEVIKIESPKGGDYLRWMPPLTGKTSYGFNALNSGKQSVAVDLKTPDGVEIIRRLVQDADVLIESFRPGVMDRLGLGFDSMREINPRLVYCAISGYGQDGPLSDKAGHDLNYQGLAGVLGMTGPRGAKPTMPGAQLADIGGGALWSLTGILAALVERERTGVGRFLDISMTDGSLAFLQMALAPHLGGGTPMSERGGDTLTGGLACYDLYETKDAKYMSLAALEPKFWVAFCTAAERPDLLSRQFGRAKQIEETRADLDTLFKTRTREEWTVLLRDVDCCCEPVLEPEELAEHPLHQERKNVIEDSAGLQRLRTPLRPRDAGNPLQAPGLGANTAGVLRQVGYSDEEIASLSGKSVVLCSDD
jgi:alpha-methylacyl-CoA racemase